MGDSAAVVTSKVANEELVSTRHAQLIAASAELFLRKGFHATTIREIADAVGWKMGTLYMYISRKEDILYLTARTIMHQLAVDDDRIAPRPTALETFRAAAEYYFRIVAKMHNELKLLYRESATLPPEYREAVKQAELRVWRFFQGIIARGIDNGEFRPVDVGIVGYNVIMLAHMWALKGWTLGQEYEFEPYLATQLSLLCDQLRPGSGMHVNGASPAGSPAAPTETPGSS
jgi:AcrR family transcriptional regulator